MNRPYPPPYLPDERPPGAWIGAALLALAFAVGLIAGVAIGWATGPDPCTGRADCFSTVVSGCTDPFDPVPCVTERP